MSKDFSVNLLILKLVFAILYQIFIYYQMIALQKYEKCFLFHLFFVFLSSPLFLPVSHCFRGWSKKNLKVYDTINCISKNLITHFVWYLKKEIGCDIEILSIIRVPNKEHFYGKIMQKYVPKACPRPLCNLAI